MSSREIVLDILYKVFKHNAYANILLRSLDETFSKEDKAFISNLVYGTLRNYILLEKQWDDLAKKRDLKTALIIDMSIYQMFYMDKVPDYAIINEAVNLVDKHKKGFVNSILHKVLDRGFIYYDDLYIKTSHPKWIIDLWTSHYGKDIAERIALSNIQKANIYGRINTLKINKDEFINKHDITFIDEYAFISKDNILTFDEFNNGEILIQDLHSQEVVKYLDVKEGMEVLDLCSAPGTKTQEIAMLMNNKGKIIACDIHEHRIKLIEQLMDKTGVDIVETRINDAREKRFQNGSFDRILIDAPCSGLGDLSHKPEIKYHLEPSDIDELIITQEKILNNNCNALKIGGLLVYSTCSLNKKENEKQIAKFIDKNPNFTLEFENTLFPFEDNADGFYLSVLRRIS